MRSTFELLKVDISSLVTVGNSLYIFSFVVVGISFVPLYTIFLPIMAIFLFLFCFSFQNRSCLLSIENYETDVGF